MGAATCTLGVPCDTSPRNAFRGIHFSILEVYSLSSKSERGIVGLLRSESIVMRTKEIAVTDEERGRDEPA